MCQFGCWYIEAALISFLLSSPPQIGIVYFYLTEIIILTVFWVNSSSFTHGTVSRVMELALHGLYQNTFLPFLE